MNAAPLKVLIDFTQLTCEGHTYQVSMRKYNSRGTWPNVSMFTVDRSEQGIRDALLRLADMFRKQEETK